MITPKSSRYFSLEPFVNSIVLSILRATLVEDSIQAANVLMRQIVLTACLPTCHRAFASFSLVHLSSRTFTARERLARAGYCDPI
jgi:hypothetical protein